MAKKREKGLTPEELLRQALVLEGEWPYKVPGNWVWTRVGSIATFVGGGTPSKSNLDFWGGDIPWASIKDIKGDFLFDTVDRITEEGLSSSATNCCNEGDLILATRIEPGKTIISRIVTAINQDLKIVKSPLESNFLHFYFQNNRQQFISRSSGSTVLGITLDNVSEVEFPLPPLPEQQRIVDRIESLFEKLDQAKGIIQDALDSFENRKAAILHKAFSGELTRKWREENGVGMESWEKNELASIAEIVSGYAFNSGDFSPTHEVPCVKITNVGVGEYQVGEDGDCLPLSFISEYNRFVVNKDDILIALTRPFINSGLKVCIYPYNSMALLNQRVALVRYPSMRYLYYFMRTNVVLEYVKDKSKTTNQPNLSIKDLNKLIIPMPSFEEQQEITRILDSIFENEQGAFELSTLTDKIDLMKKSTLARAFRGELGTNDPEEESALTLLNEHLLNRQN